MSDSYIRLIPTDPQYVPDVAAQQAAKELLRLHLPEAKKIRLTVSKEVELVDPGTNLERANCPACGAGLDLDWCWDAVNTAHKRSRLNDLTVVMPCCAATTSLNDLLYDSPLGFARCVLEAANPNSTGLDADQIATIEQLLGCKLRQIWAHY